MALRFNHPGNDYPLYHFLVIEFWGKDLIGTDLRVKTVIIRSEITD